MSYKNGEKVVVNHAGKMEMGKIIKIVRTTSSNAYYNILLERGVELFNIPEKPLKLSLSFINKKFTKLYNPV